MTFGKDYSGRRVNPKTFFEPVYDPSLPAKLSDNDFKERDWNFDNDKGPCRYTLRGEALLEKHGKFNKFEKITFTECDFVGVFDTGALVFSNCVFDKCEFRGEFRNVKFSNCDFKDSSLSLLKFYNCQLRDCSYKRIGLSGNETQLFSTDITHPGRFLAAATTNTDHLPEGINKEYQLLRLQRTRATLARVILQNQASEGSDESYYDAVKAATLYGTISRRVDAKLMLPKFDKPEIAKDRTVFSAVLSHVYSAVISTSSQLEYAFLWSAGNINAWGRSIFRVICVGIALSVALAMLRAFSLGLSKEIAFLQTLETFLLFGYTKHSLPNEGMLPQSIDVMTAIFGLSWYAIAAATIVNKVTRVRG